MRALLVLLVALVFAAGCGSGDDEAASGDTTDTTTTTSTVTECADVDAPEPRTPEPRSAPTVKLDSSKTYTLVFDTSCGSFTVTLDQELAPNTVASLVALATDGFFDDTVLHRVVRDFVIQGGDPTQTGGGGPGYSTVDVPPSDAEYMKGTVAMAKTLTEAPGTSGSQFFVITADGTGLPPEYAIVGEVTEGIETIDRINALGPVDSDGRAVDGPPTKPVVVNSVTASGS